MFALYKEMGYVPHVKVITRIKLYSMKNEFADSRLRKAVGIDAHKPNVACSPRSQIVS
jgi:hypothetical protein